MKGRTGIGFIVFGVSALLWQGGGVANAWDAPASATVACAADLHHWEATIVVSDVGLSAYTITSSSLDASAWSSGAVLTGLAVGVVVPAGASVTAHATGIPLTTAGAVIEYTGRYADGRVETNMITLARPVPSCDVPAPTTTTVAPDTATLPATTMPVATTVPLAPSTTAVEGAEVTVGGAVESTTTATTIAPAAVLGTEDVAAVSPTLARTGSGTAGPLVLAALALVLVGVTLRRGAGGPERSTR